MPLYMGGHRIAKLYRGAAPIARAYRGAGQVLDPSPAADPYTVLLLHCDGADESTGFPDSALGGSAPHAVTVLGDARIDTSAPRFGTGAALFDGSGDALGISDSAELDLGVGGAPFCIELFVNSSTWGGNHAFFGRGGGAASWSNTNGHMITFGVFGGSVFFQWNNGSGSVPSQITASPPSTGSYAHVAATYDGTNIRLFVGGSLVATSGTVTGINPPTTRNITRIGQLAVGSEYYSGLIDEIRISKGAPRYVSNFTPPAAPFSSYL